jgi:hypothetical protein
VPDDLKMKDLSFLFYVCHFLTFWQVISLTDPSFCIAKMKWLILDKTWAKMILKLGWT